jgi:hypothetical protein
VAYKPYASSVSTNRAKPTAFKALPGILEDGCCRPATHRASSFSLPKKCPAMVAHEERVTFEGLDVTLETLRCLQERDEAAIRRARQEQQEGGRRGSYGGPKRCAVPFTWRV